VWGIRALALRCTPCVQNTFFLHRIIVRLSPPPIAFDVVGDRTGSDHSSFRNFGNRRTRHEWYCPAGRTDLQKVI
jgi:hypothetical protein